MAHPAFLQLNTVTCNSTEDLVGSDDIIGVMGADRFAIGSFSGPEQRQVNIVRPIVAGITTLRIIETDLIDPDDELGVIDLSQDLDQSRTVRLQSGSADYELQFSVQSEPD
jgi:hypothetical protein